MQKYDRQSLVPTSVHCKTLLWCNNVLLLKHKLIHKIPPLIWNWLWQVTFQKCVSLSSPRMTRSECIEHPHCPAAFNRCKLTLWCFPKPDYILPDRSVPPSLLCAAGRWDLTSRAVDRSQTRHWWTPTISSQQTWLCVSDVLLSLFESQLEVPAVNTIPSPQTIKENVKQGWECNRLWSNIDTRLLLWNCDCGKFFTQWRKHNLGNIRMDGKIIILPKKNYFV